MRIRISVLLGIVVAAILACGNDELSSQSDDPAAAALAMATAP